MELYEMLSQSVRYPFSKVKRLLILGILLATGYILIIPLIFALGYYMRIIESSLEGSPELPPFNRWKKMFIDGLKYILVLLVYLGVPGIIACILAIFTGIMFYAVMGSIEALSIAWILLTAIIVVVPYFLSYMAITNMVKENSLQAAFDFKKTWKIVKKFGSVPYIAAITMITLLTYIFVLITNTPEMLHMGLIEIYSVSIAVNILINSYLCGFEGKLMALIYQEGIK